MLTLTPTQRRAREELFAGLWFQWYGNPQPENYARRAVKSSPGQQSLWGEEQERQHPRRSNSLQLAFVRRQYHHLPCL